MWHFNFSEGHQYDNVHSLGCYLTLPLTERGSSVLCANIYDAVATEAPGCSFLVGLLGLQRLGPFCIKIPILRRRSPAAFLVTYLDNSE